MRIDPATSGMKTVVNLLGVLNLLVTITELAESVGVPIEKIYEWRQAGRGPVGVRIPPEPRPRISFR